jgi:hypothetical protein
VYDLAEGNAEKLPADDLSAATAENIHPNYCCKWHDTGKTER